MPLISGSVASGTGLAKELFDDLLPKLGLPPLSLEVEAGLADMCDSIAQTVIAHFIANGVVSTTVASGIAVATAGSAAAQTGATTAPGAGTGSIS